MPNVFNLFYKSRGGISTSNNTTEYNYPVGEIEADNFQELGHKAMEKINELGIGAAEFNVDIINAGKDYERGKTNGTGKTSQQDYTSHIA